MTKMMAELWEIIERQTQLIKDLTKTIAEQENLIDELMKG